MADNYIENKYEEYLSKKVISTKNKRNINKSLDSLLLINRSYRAYDKNYVVSEKELIEIIGVNNKIPSAKNQQVLRFKLVTKENSSKVLQNIKLGAALAHLNLPLEGTEPEAFIIICSQIPENKLVDIDLGISVQSMLLKAAELKLNGICIGAFNKTEIVKEFNLELEPVLILAVGKGNEKIQLLSIGESENHIYYRQDNLHFVPKVKIEDLII